MADILIRGMEMPRTCAECPSLSQWDDCGINHEWKFADEFDKTKDRLPSCPIIPLPEGHGRLIDADAVIEVYTPDSYDLNKMHMTRESFDKLPTVAAIKKAIRNAPTIVPAEGGGKDG